LLPLGQNVGFHTNNYGTQRRNDAKEYKRMQALQTVENLQNPTFDSPQGNRPSQSIVLAVPLRRCVQKIQQLFSNTFL
jgi:hypothetical protein